MDTGTVRPRQHYMQIRRQPRKEWAALLGALPEEVRGITRTHLLCYVARKGAPVPR